MRLRFEKVSDVSEDYCHLDVFIEGKQNAFMDIGIGEDKEPIFNFYEDANGMSLSVEEWRILLDRAYVFTKDEIDNENTFQEWLKGDENQ